MKKTLLYVYGGVGGAILIILLVIYLIFPTPNKTGPSSNATSTTPGSVTVNPTGDQTPTNASADGINNYLAQNIAGNTGSGKIFCSSEGLGSSNQNGQAIGYLWALCAEYTLQNGALSAGPALNTPVALALKNGSGSYTIVGFSTPQQGASYAADIQTIFPQNVRANGLFDNNSTYHREHTNSLAAQNDLKARAYFNLH